MYELSLRGHPDAPVLHQRSWKFNVAAPMHHAPSAHLHPHQWKHSHDVPLTNVCVSLKLATANVLSLSPQSEASVTHFGARAEMLAAQFRAAGLQCIGLQET